MEILVIGGSAGSLAVVLQILPLLVKEWNFSIVLIFHRKEDDESPLIDLLSRRTLFEVKEIEDKESIRPQVVYVAPADYHVLIEKDKTFSLDYSEKINYSRPSIDVTFESAAEIFGPAVTAMLLSGANADGVEGLKSIKHAGGLVVVQDPQTAEVPFMPKTALDNVSVDVIFSVERTEQFFKLLTESSAH